MMLGEITARSCDDDAALLIIAWHSRIGRRPFGPINAWTFMAQAY